MDIGILVELLWYTVVTYDLRPTTYDFWGEEKSIRPRPLGNLRYDHRTTIVLGELPNVHWRTKATPWLKPLQV